MSDRNDKYRTTPYPRTRGLMVDGGWLGRRRHTIHGLVEVDVTQARDVIRRHKERTGETLSFTAYVMTCVGQAVEMNKYMHAYRNWKNQFVLFDEVDVNTLFEVKVDGRKMIRPHIIRAVNKKTFREIHEEIRAFQTSHDTSRESKLIDWFILLPSLIRRAILVMLAKNPPLFKEMSGTVSMTGVGMFGTGGGWAIPVPNHTLQITLGGIAKKPGVVADRIEIREYLSITMSIDHDIVDGAPAARFAERLKELIESGQCLYGTVTV